MMIQRRRQITCVLHLLLLLLLACLSIFCVLCYTVTLHVALTIIILATKVTFYSNKKTTRKYGLLREDLFYKCYHIVWMIIKIVHSNHCSHFLLFYEGPRQTTCGGSKSIWTTQSDVRPQDAPSCPVWH